jgi:DNA-binding SARP family transcriptional activator/tetratricopeptide (TPR) repeat protein
MGTEFFLLGPLGVHADGTPVLVRAAKRRALLAALLLRANHVVPVDDLAEVLWGEGLPSDARSGVQNYVMRLRQALGPAGSRITTQPRGYLMRVEAGELDLDRFEGLLRDARIAAREARWPDAVGGAAAALALWRGEPLADLGSDLLAAREGPRLSELRLQALETRIEAELQLGRPGEVIGELRQLAAEQPLRERLHGLLMLALYRDGRQAEALAVYQHARSLLIDELGTEPGPDLRRLHQQILTADPAVALTVAGAAGQALAPPAPRQLPAAVAGFTGRAAVLAALTGMLDQARTPGTVVISAIGGTAGVGKTALALHWAHQVAGRFADGQLHVNLRGHDPSGNPATPTEAIRGFLDALGVPPERIPPDPQAQAGLYRSLLSGKQMLIVLDNAVDERQVRPLLPASPASLVVVTSRSQLSGLAATDGARLLSLDVLSHAEAVQMLTARLGAGRVAAEPAAAGQIADLCACLPLALAVAAARAAARPGFPLAALAGELADSAGRLDALDGGDPATSVRAVFSWSYQQLGGEAARMFRLLGLHPGPDISVAAAASLVGSPTPGARRLLRELAGAHLIIERVHARYAFHDLLRAYAAEQALAHDDQDERDAATGRVLDHYLHTAARANLLLDPASDRVVLAPLRLGAAAGQPADYSQAMDWFGAEHQVLLAAITLAAGSGSDSDAWQLPWAMDSFVRFRGHWQDWAAIQRTALAAATRLGDTAAQALSGRLLANACRDLGDHDEALRHYASSLTSCQRLGNRLGEAKVQQSLGLLAGLQGRNADALGHSERALHLYQAIGDQASEAQALNNVGWYHGLLGDYQQARAFCQRSLTLCAESGDRFTEGNAWDSLGYAEHHLGNLAEAAACYQRALNLCRECGDRFAEADILTHLGDTCHAAGELAGAREAWQQALAILEDFRHPDAGQVLDKLACTTGNTPNVPSAERRGMHSPASLPGSHHDDERGP